MEVISVKKVNLNKLGYRDLQYWLQHPKHVYIGRDMTFYVKGAKKSKWANPFSVKKYGREECLKLYREYIQNTPELIEALSELEGKVLGCWCRPESCHGDVLIKLLQENREIEEKEKPKSKLRLSFKNQNPFRLTFKK